MAYNGTTPALAGSPASAPVSNDWRIVYGAPASNASALFAGVSGEQGNDGSILRRVVAVLDAGPWHTDQKLTIEIATATPLMLVLGCAVLFICRRLCCAKQRVRQLDSAIDLSSDETDDEGPELQTPSATDDEEYSANGVTTPVARRSDAKAESDTTPML